MGNDDGHRPGPLQSLFRAGDRTAAGAGGERWAEEYLQSTRGCRILERNWRNPGDRREEIDLVAREGETLVFVEVKLRAPGARVPGYHAVDGRKRRAWRRAVRAYLALLDPPPRTFRCDVIEVVPAAAGTEMLHFENIGLFPKYFRP